MTIIVHNIHTDGPPPAGDERHVYVGRAGRYGTAHGLTGSPLANPFRMQGERTRDWSISSFTASLALVTQAPEAHLSPRGREMRAELERLTELARTGDLHLYCWCFPSACHADTIKEEIERRLQEVAA